MRGYVWIVAWIDAWMGVEVWAGATATIARKRKLKKQRGKEKNEDTRAYLNNSRCCEYSVE